ncbi:MAG: hypothetical protein DWQ02_00815 [Bacteroidetes bacterium]|nr:MAG: hypothetical protein DWQ02_00815 [Bacteroidota bacterium]
MHQEQIIHKAIVKRLTSEGVEVVLEDPPGCDACNAKSSCGLNPDNQGEENVKSFFIPVQDNVYQPGESVEVSISPSIGLKAVFWGYLFPFIIMMVVLIIGLNFFEELIAGIAALAVVALFYLVLYLNKDRMKKTFAIDLKKFGS